MIPYILMSDKASRTSSSLNGFIAPVTNLIVFLFMENHFDRSSLMSNPLPPFEWQVVLSHYLFGNKLRVNLIKNDFTIEIINSSPSVGMPFESV